MSYQTGTVSSAADLASAIRSFAVANGWTLSVDVLSKGGCHVRITAPSASEVRIEGAKNGNFNSPDICPRYSRIFLTSWPGIATYHMAAFDTPDTVWCTVVYGVTDHMHLGFGTVEKYGSWGGGAWFHASHTADAASKDSNISSVVDGSGGPYGSENTTEAGLFWSPRMNRTVGSGSYFENAASSIQCDLRGRIWEPPNDSTGTTIHCPTVIGPVHKLNPNTFNGQTLLTPFQIFLQNTDGHYMAVGHVEHVRFVKLTNYNPGDVIEIGPDRWKLFPWYRLDIGYPDGRQTGLNDVIRSTGLLGVAVRYDGV